MKRESVLLTFVALATCLFTYNSVHRLSSDVALTEQHQLVLGTSAQPVRTSAISTGVSDTSKPRSAFPKAGSSQFLEETCRPLPHTDYWGDAVAWGPSNKKSTAEECCAACKAYTPPSENDVTCNVWVWCGDKAKCNEQYQDCWLKHLAHPEGSSPRTGPEIPWTSGVFGLVDTSGDDSVFLQTDEDRSFHTVISAQGSAVHWQARVHYYWFLKTRKQCRAAGRCHMGGFTRLLHSGQPDELMDEIPTSVVRPLEDRDHGGYVVLNRPWAFVQWLRKAKIKERFVLMSEPDHIWLKPMPNLMHGNRPAAFPFFYIEPAKKEFQPITEKFTGKLTLRQAESIAPIGNAPTMMSLEDLQRVAPIWMNTSHGIFDDEEAHKAWGWVQEMYGFTIACYKAGVGKVDLYLRMMSQPPWDSQRDAFYILHYTYGMDYTLQGEHMPGKYGEWRFDKRSYSGKPPPRNLGEPPAGMKNELVRHLIHAINEASSVIPGWDEYAATGHARELWDGKL